VEWRRSSPRIGLNPGSGSRWPNKRWPLQSWQALASLVLTRWPNAAVVLLGGPNEDQLIERLQSGLPRGRVFSTGCDNPVRDFAALVDQLDLVVTGDTLALHLALALRKQVVGLFGPTSATEIESYGRGNWLTPESGCACFYRKSCTQPVPCLESILPERVLEAVARGIHG